MFEGYYGEINLPKCILVGDTAFHQSNSTTSININYQAEGQTGLADAITRGTIVTYVGQPSILKVQDSNGIEQFTVNTDEDEKESSPHGGLAHSYLTSIQDEHCT